MTDYLSKVIDRTIISIMAGIVCSSLASLSCIPWLAISFGFLGAMSIVHATMKLPYKKLVFTDILTSAIGSQMGWVALLI